MSELHALSASAMVAAYRDGSLSPVEVTQAVLQRIERCEPALCATYALDADAALSMARAAEARWRAGFGDLAREVIECDGLGVTTSDYGALQFKRVRRPIYPLDPM